MADIASISAEEAALIQGEGDRWRADGAYLPALSEARSAAPQNECLARDTYLRPPMIQLIGCDRVWLQGYQVRNTPFWQHHPVNCRDILIRKVLAKSHGPKE